MKRREFLKMIAFMTGSAIVSGCDALESGDERILVVGAGIAGLAAAKTLQNWGYEVIVLEARDRAGGRIWTSRQWANSPLDMGASWIHGITKNPIAELAKEHNIQTKETDYENQWIYKQDGREFSASDYETLAEYSRLFQVYMGEAIEGYDEDVSIQTVLNEILAAEEVAAADKRMILYLLNTVIEHEYAADIADLSVFSLDAGEEFGGEDVIFPDGYDQIIEVLADGLDVRLQEVVQQINYGDDGVTITTDREVYEGDRAVITLPLGVLQSGRVQFSPALPNEKQNAIQDLGMGLLDKVYLRFPEIFWPETAELLGYVSQNKGEWAEWLNIAHYTGDPILLGFNAAAFARTVETWSDQQIVDSAMAALRTMFGQDVPAPLAYQITRWAADPFALGSYSYQPPGTDGETMAALAAPVAGRLFFAGEATSRAYQATVHGAYLSGLRAAEELWDTD